MSSRGDDELTREEKAAIEQYLQNIEGFRASIKSWRTNGTTATKSAQEVVEKTEVAFNYNLGDVTSIFESYETVDTKVMVNATSTTWSGSAVVAFYDAVKAQVKSQLGAGPGRTLRLLALGTPTLENSQYKVDVFIMTGINKLSSLPTTTTDDKRWTLADLGFTDPTPCGGSANDIIGADANNKIGIYQPINAGPGSGGNTPLPGKVVSKILRGDHNLFGANYPNGTDYPLAYPPVATFYIPDKLVLYYNDFAINPAIPDWNCPSNAQIHDFTDGNIALGESMLSVVSNVQIGSFSIKRRLVATAAGVFVGTTRPPNSPPNFYVNYQEHPTRHYYGLVFNPPAPVCCVDEI